MKKINWKAFWEDQGVVFKYMGIAFTAFFAIAAIAMMIGKMRGVEW